MSDTITATNEAPPVTVLMDDREPLELMQQAVVEVGGLALEVVHLSVGDYLIDDTLLVERKTYPDLVRSIIDGRLFQQAHRLALAGHPTLMVLEGEAADLQPSNMTWESIQGALITITVFFHIPLLHTQTPKQTMQTFLYVAKQRRSVNTDALVRHGRRPKRKAALQSHILQGLPDIGPKRARVLLQHFGSVEGVMKAGMEQLSNIEGMGQRRAQRIRWAVEEPRVGYAEQQPLAAGPGTANIAQ